MPAVDPGGTTQGVPGQQSEWLVHAPPVATHVVPHTKPVPDGSGTQGLPQQSALDAQKLVRAQGLTTALINAHSSANAVRNRMGG